MSNSSSGPKDLQDEFAKYDEIIFTGKQIKAARDMLNWEQTKLASLSGVSVPTIKRIEAIIGIVNITTNNKRMLLSVFDKANIVFVNDENEVSVKLLKK